MTISYPLIVALLALAGALYLLIYTGIHRPPTGQQGPRVYQDRDFVKSPNEVRQHHAFWLPNGLQVMLVSDPKTKHAAASMDIRVGSGSDPAHRQGLAHYLEHMLFLGTKNFPVADAFQAFIREHGGTYNAYTSYDHTNYFFDIKKDHFEEALARFADFFTNPLFNREFAERERNVVDSEFHAGLKQDETRYFAVLKQAFNPQHPLTGFHIGNKQTLAGNATELYDDLRTFFTSHYRADIMKLTLYADVNLNTMQALARKLFGNISAEPHQDPLPQLPFFAENSLPALLQFRPIKERRFMDYYFAIPSQLPHYRSKPAHYVAHLFNARNPGGLYDLLKQRGWINHMQAELDLSLPNESLFNIHLDLTRKGEKNLPAISSLVLKSARVFRQSAIDEWRFDELRAVNALYFRYIQPGSALPYVRKISRLLQEVPTERVLSNALWDEYAPTQIEAILDAMRPDNMLVIHGSPSAKKGQQDPYYQADYHLQKLSGKMLAAYTDTARAPKIKTAPPNPFAAEAGDIDLNAAPPSVANQTLPERLPIQNVNAWYKFNDLFITPRASARINFQPIDAAMNSARHHIHARVLVAMLHEKLDTTAYQAEVVDYSYDLDLQHHGLALSIRGYSLGMERWTRQIAEVLFDFQYDKAMLARVKEKIKQRLANRAFDSPLKRLGQTLSEALLIHFHDEQQLLAELAKVTPASLTTFARNYFKRTRVMALVHGDLPPREAENLITLLTPASMETEAFLQSVHLEKVGRMHGKGRFVAAIPNKQNDSAMQIYYQAADNTIRTRIQTALLINVIQPLFFQQMRTEQELGYIVTAHYHSLNSLPGISFVIQSNRQNGHELVRRSDAFLKTSLVFWQYLPAADFENNKRGLINRLLDEPHTLEGATKRYWDHIEAQFHTFDVQQQMADELATMTKQELIDYHQALLRRNNSYVFITDAKLKPPHPKGTFINTTQRKHLFN